MSKGFSKALVVYGSLFLAAGTMSAQSANIFGGIGTMMDTSTGLFNSTYTGTSYGAPKLTGLFGDAGFNVMANQYFGIGTQWSWRATQGDYEGLSDRPLFYDINAVIQPMGAHHRVVPEFQLGAGQALVRFDVNNGSCAQFVIGCATTDRYIGTAAHFQADYAVAARFYMTHHLFLRPSLSLHWVNDFREFGSNWVPEYNVGVGYTFGTGYNPE